MEYAMEAFLSILAIAIFILFPLYAIVTALFSIIKYIRIKIKIKKISNENTEEIDELTLDIKKYKKRAIGWSIAVCIILICYHYFLRMLTYNIAYNM